MKNTNFQLIEHYNDKHIVYESGIVDFTKRYI